MAKTLLESEPDRTATVIVLDWNEGSNPPYVQAAANTRIVGAITAHLLHTLAEEVGMPNLDHVHLIGHSLGAHTCGYTGFYLQRDFNEKIGRITGMDPASPLFTGTSHEVRLDRSDAKFVDVIHTDANPYTGGGLGMVPRVGHVDFYPNGGYDNPGCDRHLQEYLSKKQKTLIDNLQEWFGCNHVRSHRYLTESIKNRNGFKAVTCSSYEEYRQGRCVVCGENKHQCLRMGLSSYEDYKRLVKKRVIKDGDAMVAYLLTGDEAPFAREHFKITVKVSNSEESEDHGGEVGTLTIDLTTRGKKSTGMMKFSDNALFLEPGQEEVRVVAGNAIKDATHAMVDWEYQTNILNPFSWRIVESPRIFLEYIRVYSIEDQKELKLCPQDGAPVIAGNPIELRSTYC
ncbi:PNLIP family protein [Megaselia abdita]